MAAYSTNYSQLRDRYEALQQKLNVAQGDRESLKRDLDLSAPSGTTSAAGPAIRRGRPKPLGYTTSSRPCPPFLSIATEFCGLQPTPPTFANAVRSAVPASFELPPPGSLRFLALVPVILAAAVLTWLQVRDLEDLAGVLGQAVATPSPVTTPEAPVDAPEISFAVAAPVPKCPTQSKIMLPPSKNRQISVERINFYPDINPD